MIVSGPFFFFFFFFFLYRHRQNMMSVVTHGPLVSYFFQKTGFDISCKLSSKEIICMKYHTFFLGKIRKMISACPLMKILPRVLSFQAVLLCKTKCKLKILLQKETWKHKRILMRIKGKGIFKHM